MSFVANLFSTIQRQGEQSIGDEPFFEVRIENDANGNPIYVARSPIPNADPALNVWFIVKMHYDANDFLARVQQPNAGGNFVYSYNDRASYFA